MRLWRLSSLRQARNFNGGYGLSNDGRWNTKGRAITYCSTGPALTALEKRVHVGDPSLLPPFMMVEYDVPDKLTNRAVVIDDLPADWISQQNYTQALGDQWLDTTTEVLLFVPSVVMPLADVPDRNVLINHRAAGAASIKIAGATPFTLDPRLFNP